MSSEKIDTNQDNEEDEELDEWDKRIEKSGCAKENEALTDCYYDTKDWRKCTDQMLALRKCWSIHGNDVEQQTKV